MRELLPSPVIFQVAPQSLNRVQRRTIGGQPHAPDMLRPPKPLGGVCTTIIQQKAVQTGGKGLSQGIHKPLQGLGIQLWPCEEEGLPCGRGHRTIDIEPCEEVLECPNGLDPARREAAAAPRQQATTTFVLAEHAHRAGMLRRDDALELLLTSGLKCPNGLRVFGCDWGAAPCAWR